MKPRAVIFDVYGTLLQVDPAPSDRAPRWDRLWQQVFGVPARLDLPEFAAACDQVIAREHAAARALGVAHPEVFWPAVVGEVLPELGRCSAEVVDDFLYAQAGLWHTVTLMPGTGPALAKLRAGGVQLGIASNAQPYTLRELATALATVGLSLEIFASDLSFWSFAHGFSKPDPHVFRLLAARLRARGMSAGEAMMIGDRIDNDLAPARAQGWQTWRFAPGGMAGDGGDWEAFVRCVEDF